MNFDPYKELDVPRDVEAGLLKRAYRRLSRKHHPDRNPGDPGAAERFERVARAFALLSDPARRAEYDRTGNSAEPRPAAAGDPAEAELLALIGQYLIQAIQDAESGPFGPGVKRTDLAERTRAKIREQKKAAEQILVNGRRGLAAMREAAERFGVDPETPNHPATVLRARISGLERELAGVEADVARFDRALDYLKGVRYRTDGNGSTASVFASKMIIGTS